MNGGHRPLSPSPPTEEPPDPGGSFAWWHPSSPVGVGTDPPPDTTGALTAEGGSPRLCLRATNKALVLVCSRHHHLLHSPGWNAKLLPDATLEVTDPHGHIHTATAPDPGRAPLLPLRE